MIWQLVGASILVTLVVGLGMLLFVVPGVIWSLMFELTVPCMVQEGQTIRGARRPGSSRESADSIT